MKIREIENANLAWNAYLNPHPSNDLRSLHDSYHGQLGVISRTIAAGHCLFLLCVSSFSHPRFLLSLALACITYYSPRCFLWNPAGRDVCMSSFGVFMLVSPCPWRLPSACGAGILQGSLKLKYKAWVLWRKYYGVREMRVDRCV